MNRILLAFIFSIIFPTIVFAAHSSGKFNTLHLDTPLSQPNGGLGNGTGDASALTVVLGGAINRTLAARFGEVIDILDYSTNVGQGNGVVDDGPMFRAALAACVSGNGFRRMHVPQASTQWLINSLDSSGLGGLVIGDGTHQNSCWLDGDSLGTGALWANGGTQIKLGNGLNRPLVYIRQGVGSPIFSNLTLNGNKSNQTGWSGGPIGGKLFTMQIADGAAGIEGGVFLNDVNIIYGYNGNIYQGGGRGIVTGRNVFLGFSGNGQYDASYYANGYDVAFWNLSIGENTGNGLTINEGSAYQIHGGAIFQNSGNGIVVQGSLVTYSYVSGVLLQQNGCNGILINPAAPFSGQVGMGHVWVGLTFDGNSHTANGVCSDFYNSGSTIESLIAPVFGGAQLTTLNRPAYNVYNALGAVTSVVGQTLGTGTTATVSFTNDVSRVVTNQQGSFNIGNVAALAGGWLASVNDNRQFHGEQWSNGTNAFAKLYGTTAANDSGTFLLLNAGVIEVQLSAGNGISNYFTANAGFGGNTAPQYPVDVTGTINATNVQATTGTFASLSVENVTQYGGQSWGDDVTAYAKVFGSNIGNSIGVYQLLSNGVVEVQLSAGNAVADYFTPNVGFGGNANPQYPVDVIGAVNATSYRSGGAVGITTTKTAGSCTFTITNGLITAVTGC